MASNEIRCNLGAAVFPMATELSGRTIIVPGQDENYDRYNAANTDRDKGVPQVYYMHNVLPVIPGFQSVGYTSQIAPAVPGSNEFDRVFNIQVNGGNKYLFAPRADNTIQVFDNAAGGWVDATPVGFSYTSSTLITLATVQGTTYIFFAFMNAYIYDPETQKLVVAVLDGLTISEILGLVSANGYLIAYTADGTLAWSNQQVPTDFVPNLATGAGGGSINEVKGKLQFALPLNNGFLLYNTDNIVSCTYTGNADFPYVFVEVPWTRGVDAPEDVSWANNGDVHYAMTSAGLMEISNRQSQLVFQELSDFLGMRKFEDFDEDILTFIEEYLTSPMRTRVAVIGARYLCISYGREEDAPNFTHVMVQDLLAGRWGKLKVIHRQLFEWQAPTEFSYVPYSDPTWDGVTYNNLLPTYGDYTTATDPITALKKTIAVLQQDGTILIVDMDLSEVSADGVFVLGKFQFNRNNFITSQAFNVETVDTGNDFDAYLLYTLDGKTLQPFVTPYLAASRPQLRQYLNTTSAMNISLMFIGAFNLTSVLFKFTLGGKVFFNG